MNAEQLALEFLSRVWELPHDLDAIDEIMTEDYVITSGGKVIQGREAFKAWAKESQIRLLDARTKNLEILSDQAGGRVVLRWICTGRNSGIFGLSPDKRSVSFTGIAIWKVRDGRLA